MKIRILFVALFVGMTAVAQNKKIGINTDLPRTTLDVNGDVTIRKVEKLSGNIKPLYIDGKGLVGTMVSKDDVVNSTIFSANSNGTILELSGNEVELFNTGTKDIAIPVKSGHMKINTLGITVNKEAFQINEGGIYELNSFLNLYIRSAKDNKTFMIVTLQISTDGGNNWINISGSRPVFLQANGALNHPHNIPTTIARLEKGTMVRMAFKRSLSNGKGQGDPVTEIKVISASSYSTKGYELVIKKL